MRFFPRIFFLLRAPHEHMSTLLIRRIARNSRDAFAKDEQPFDEQNDYNECVDKVFHIVSYSMGEDNL